MLLNVFHSSYRSRNSSNVKFSLTSTLFWYSISNISSFVSMFVMINDVKYFYKFPCLTLFIFFFSHQLQLELLLLDSCLISVTMHCRFHLFALRRFFLCDLYWLIRFKDLRTCSCLLISRFLLVAHNLHIILNQMFVCMLVPCKSLKHLNCLLLYSLLFANLK